MGGTLRSWQIRCQRRDRSAFSGPRMSLVVVVSGPHAGASAGAPGLVETRRWVRESCGGDTHGTGDMPTGAAGAAGGTSEGCGEGELLCERGCVDLLSDEARCGCDDECKSDEMCVVGECREVEGGGLRELSLRGPVSGRGQRRHGQRRHGQRRRWWRRPPASPVLRGVDGRGRSPGVVRQGRRGGPAGLRIVGANVGANLGAKVGVIVRELAELAWRGCDTQV